MDRAPGRRADRGPQLDPHAAGRRGGRALGAWRCGGDVQDERPEPGHRRGVPALRHPISAGRRDALLPAPRGQGRAGLPSYPAQRHGPGQLRADPQRARPRPWREDTGGAEGCGGRWTDDPGRGRGRSSRSRGGRDRDGRTTGSRADGGRKLVSWPDVLERHRRRRGRTAGRRSVPGPGAPSVASRLWWGGCGRGLGCCRCPSCSTP